MKALLKPARKAEMTQLVFEERLCSDDLNSVQAVLAELTEVIARHVLVEDVDTALKRIRWMVQPLLDRIEYLPGLAAARRYARISGQDMTAIETIIEAAAREMRLYVDAIGQFNRLMVGPHTRHLPEEIPSWAFQFERKARALGTPFMDSVFGSHERWRSLCQQKAYLPTR